MNLWIDHPWVLLLLPLALLPWLRRSPLVAGDHPAVMLIPDDRASVILRRALSVTGSIAIAATVLGIADLHRLDHSVARAGEGAHLVLLLDRSASMDYTFAGGGARGDEISKSEAARRLLTEFVHNREHDLLGVAQFSTTPLFSLPLTERRDAVVAGIDTLALPGLALTNVYAGLWLALSYFEDQPVTGSRVVLLVSDGAARIERRERDLLRRAFREHGARLYWIFLRTAGAGGPFDEPDTPQQDTAYNMPERHLHQFFQSLGVEYQAYEAEDPEALERAIARVDALENEPLIYYENVPRRDLAGLCYAVALTAVVLLLLAKLLEVRLWR